MRYTKQVLATVAVVLMAAGCSAFDEWVPADGEFHGYGVAPPSRAEAERQAYWNNYRTPVGSTGSGSGTPAGSTSDGSTNAAGQCTTGAPAPCRFPDGSWGTCCASPQ